VRSARLFAVMLVLLSSEAFAQSLAGRWERIPALDSILGAPTVVEGSSYKTHGAIAGFVVGAGVTALVLHSGGSNSFCNRSANQDAMNSTECAVLIAAGGFVGGVAGYFIGAHITRNAKFEMRMVHARDQRPRKLQIGVVRNFRGML
jgi:microcompartment protein CcmK/EutM